MTQTKSKKIIYAGSIILLLLIGFISGCDRIPVDVPDFPSTQGAPLEKFSSCSALSDALEENREKRGGAQRGFGEATIAGMAQEEAGADYSAPSTDYSQTNVQVQGVDEADIVKTDGKYIYTLSKNSLVIARAYPEQSAKIESQIDLENFNPREMFIEDDRLLIFGNSRYEVGSPYSKYPRHISTMTVKVFDISDKDDPEIIRDFDFEGNYISSRKINSWVYFIINSYPTFYEDIEPTEILPRFRDNKVDADFIPVARCIDVNYFEPIIPKNFLTIASINMDNDYSEINKEVILGSGQNVYASRKNLYVAQMHYPIYGGRGLGIPDPVESPTEKTNIHKFSLNKGKINYLGNGQVPGRILNQFSMDEYQDNFRIATTAGNVWDSERKSTNNVYILDEDLDLIGSLEDLAPGERIYSTRFMGKRGYMVTFKKVDPLFVIDLSDPRNPKVLGKLKIPGFSDYLHPYDEDHIIGIGKDTVEAEESKRRGIDFAWYQGVKLAIFDVSDVANPLQMHVELIGDRGTDSEVLRDHKAFLFDKERNLLVIPILLAEIPENVENREGNTYGDFTFQGAYVYNINLRDGFQLKGRITHFDTDEVFQKSGYYFGHSDYSIRRSIYINNILYTISNGKIKLNYLNNLAEIKELDIELTEQDYYPYEY